MTRSRELVLSFVSILALSAASAQADDPVTVVTPIDYKEGIEVRAEIVSECELQTKVPEYVQQAAGDGVTVELGDAAAAGNGRVLTLQIDEIDEFGNFWIGKRKTLGISGELRDGGQVIGTIDARRTTMGGPFGNFMGTCTLFRRCAKTLGEDVVGWLQNPQMDLMLRN
jgi:hypothetical protein